MACGTPSSLRWVAPLLLSSLAVLAGCDDRRVEHLVVFTRSGGFAGDLDRLTIDESGHAVLTTRRVPEASFELAPDDLAKLRQALEQARLRTLPRQPPSDVPDDVQYDLTYQGESVRAYDSSLPTRLRPAINHLEAIMRQRWR